jgi:hypothetical protein
VGETGDAASGFVGTVVPTISVALTGVVASGFVGTVGQSASPTLTGLVASGFVGTVLPGKAAPVTGDSAVGNVGAVGVNVSVALTGLSAQGSIGTIGKYFWTTIVDEQTPNWTSVIKSVTIDDVAVFGGGIFAMSPYAGQIKQTYVLNTSNWVVIDNSETSGWTLINSSSF